MRSHEDTLKDQIAGDWLRANGQDLETIRDFWSVIVVSALGDQIDVIAISAVRQVFVDGFAAARGASDVLVPKLPLSELFGRRLRGAIEQLGVSVLTGKQVRNIEKSADNVSVETSDGEQYDVDGAIVAVPWHTLPSIVSREILPGVDQYARFPGSPITGLHLWLDRQITDRPHAVLVGTVAQWLFRQPWSSDLSHSSEFY